MKNRSPAAVFFLSLITLGIYDIVWHVKTKNELNRLGANIPTAWLIIVPLANLYWIWKYAEGVEQVSGGKISAVLALILLLLLSIVGIAILQSEYNKLVLQPADGAPTPTQPDGLPVAVASAPSPTEPPTPLTNPLPPAAPEPPTPPDAPIATESVAPPAPVIPDPVPPVPPTTPPAV